MAEPIDIVMLSFNRLEHLIATVDAIESRTSVPYRLTVVDNASGADLRNWLADNRARFHQLILRPENEHLPAFQHGIEATTSDPFILAEPDLVVPDLDPCWLTRLRSTLDAHPDFGIIGMGLEPGNRPDVLGPEVIDPDTTVGDDLVEGNLGMWFQMVRRSALRVPFELDAQACEAVRAAGYRVGWMRTLRAWHLGWDDHKNYPGHLASKGPSTHKAYSHYREIELIPRPPKLGEFAVAAPLLAVLRAHGVPEASVLELAWSEPALAAAVPGPVCLTSPGVEDLDFGTGAAGAVALVDPPADGANELLARSFGIAADTVVGIASLETFGGCLPADLAPTGWDGRELPGPAQVALELARRADADPAFADRLGYRTLEDRESWIAVFAAAAFGTDPRRIWVWRRAVPLAVPPAVVFDPAQVTPWRGSPPSIAPAPSRTLATRIRGRLGRAALRRRVRAASR